MQTSKTNNLQKMVIRLYQNLPKEVLIHESFTAKYACMLFKKLSEMYAYPKETAQISLEGIRLGALFHDAGKIQVPREILCKTDILTEKERSLIHCHALYGGDIAVSLLKESQRKYHLTVWNMAQYHHERWDGTGYPNGLKGEEIPLSARICSVADSYDAMMGRRQYNKKEFSMEYACGEIKTNAGSQFDPVLAELFLQCLKEKTKLNPVRMG